MRYRMVNRMDPNEEKQLDPKAEFVRRVACETGLPEDKIRSIASMVGYDYASVVREARILKRGQE